MGQEIETTTFSPTAVAEFEARLAHETRLVREWLDAAPDEVDEASLGCEIEAWLIDKEMNPSPVNRDFLLGMDRSTAGAELAKFNVEFNTDPLPLASDVFSTLDAQLQSLLGGARSAARRIGTEVLLAGILATLRDDQLTMANLSDSNRYRALNEQVLIARRGRPVRLMIEGNESLVSEHRDVMLEAATTSFQLHWRMSPALIARYFNAMLVAAAPVLAVGANSPYLFGRDVWAETRIPLFEQAVPIGGYGGAASGPVHRVGFGSGWVRQSIAELFEENLEHFPVLLPTLFESEPEQFAHLRLHNGTIWRWNRAVIGFSPTGDPHVRLEHRVLPAGPTVADMVANAAFLFGLVESWVANGTSGPTSFAEAKDNFYHAARHGLSARMLWNGRRIPVSVLIDRELLPRAREGLERLQIASSDADFYLSIIEHRLKNGQTGSAWQRAFIARHPGDFAALTKSYLECQQGGAPVHTWPL